VLYRLAPDYECHPIWVGDGDSYRNLAPSDLPVTDDLQAAIAAWGRRYDETYNKTDPASSGFASDIEEQAFDHAGRQLWRRLVAELGPANEVKYFSVLGGWQNE